MSNRKVTQSCIDSCMIGYALDGMCVGLILMNDAGRVQWLNRAARNMLGLTPTGGRGKLLTQVIKDPRLAAFWHAARRSNETLLDGVPVKYPRVAELKVNATPCLDRGGELIGRVLLFCDVTRERSAQLEVSQELARQLFGLSGQRGGDAEPVGGLTPAELRVVGLLGGGLGNDEIADELGVALSTVRSHLKHIYRKLQLRSRAEAVRFAVRNGLA